MDEKELFTMALSIKDPWFIEKIEFANSQKERQIDIMISFKEQVSFKRPVDDNKAHNTINKTYRQLNFFQYKAFIHAKIPQIECKEHGLKSVKVPFKLSENGFTLLEESSS